MSHWRYEAVVPKGAGCRSFLLQVNAKGEAVMYRLDDDGQPEDFATGFLGTVLGPLLSGGYRCVVISEFADMDIDNPDSWRFLPAVDNWADLAGILNGRGKSAGAAAMAVRVYYSSGFPIKEYVQFDEKLRRWVLTGKGIEADERAALHAELRRDLEAKDAAGSGGPPA